MIRTVIVADPCEELESTVFGITEGLLAHDIEVEVILSSIGMYNAVGVDADLFIIDYGGLSVYGSSDTAEWEVRFACEWAENHPGTPVVLWTYYTARLYGDELRKTFGHLNNILTRYPTDSLYHDEEAGFWDNLKLWLGINEDKKALSGET